MRSIFRGLSVSMIALAVAGCTTPNPTPLDRPGDVPTAFTAPVADKTVPIWPELNWWDNFQSSELTELMAVAQRENLDITIAALRVLEAEANDTTAFSALLPQLGASASARDSGADNTKGTGAFSAGLSTGNYVLDFFGANQNRLVQAHENLRASRYAQSVTGLTVASAVANTYFQILTLRERIAIARRNLDLAQQVLNTADLKFKAGVSSNLDVASQTASVAQQQSRLPGLIEQEREARYTLAILLGRPPEGFDIKAQNLDGIVAPKVQGGIPSELLARRPDIAQAEANLFAAHANVDVARAAFFPQVTLSATGTTSGADIASLFNPGTFAWSLGASLAQTIFDGGATKARSDLAKAQQAEQVAGYRRTVFTAFQNVENSLGTVDAVNAQIDYIEQYQRAAAEAERISELQYREGTIDITTLINSQQSLFTAQDTLATTRLARLQNNVALYVALGGGWTQQASDAGYKKQLEWWPL